MLFSAPNSLVLDVVFVELFFSGSLPTLSGFCLLFFRLCGQRVLRGGRCLLCRKLRRRGEGARSIDQGKSKDRIVIWDDQVASQVVRQQMQPMSAAGKVDGRIDEMSNSKL